MHGRILPADGPRPVHYPDRQRFSFNHVRLQRFSATLSSWILIRPGCAIVNFG
jgi:hypothetical protein